MFISCPSYDDMKRVVKLFMTLLMVLTFLGCGNATESTSANSSDTVIVNDVDSQENVTSEYTVEEVGFERDGLHIYGELYLPSGNEPFPLVVISHGFGGNSGQVSSYAEAFAENGIAACVFDFIGGGTEIKSDGEMTDMSVLTEAKDLNVVIDELMVREDIDSTELFLLGGSQGGFVSTYVAATKSDDIKGLIAMYPAYVLQDVARSLSPDPENIPETMDLMGITIGRIYNEDAMSFDIYDVMQNYTKDVLIMHGTEDDIAPISYSERAVTVFPSAQLVKFDDAGHGFLGDDETRSAKMAVDFVKDHLGDSNTANSN